MRLLHTSDWHIGKALRNQSRRADHEAVLDEIVGLATDLVPDVIVHTGDVFDSSRPGVEDMRLAFDALHRLGGVAPVVVLAGNHDSSALFALFETIVDPTSRVTFVPKVRRPRDGGIIDIPTTSGERVRLAPLPFVHSHRLVEFLEDPAGWAGDYRDGIRKIESMLGRGLADGWNPATDVAIFAAHLHVGGAVLAHSERGPYVKAEYATELDHLPPASYAAFGHIHKPQALPGGTVTGRYAGSPIQLDFGEVGEAKTLVVVEATPGRPAKVTPVNLTAGRRLARFAGTIEALAATAESYANSLVSLVVRTDKPAVGLAEAVRAVLPPSAEIVELDEECAARRTTVLSSADAVDINEEGFDDLLDQYLSERPLGSSNVTAVRSTFTALLATVDAATPASFEIEARIADVLAGEMPVDGPSAEKGG